MRLFLLTLSTLPLILIDITSKWYIEKFFSSGHFSLLGDILSIHLVYNHGVAFSMPIHGLALQILTILLILTIIIYYLREEYPKDSRLIDTGFVLIIAGAVSHAYERIRYERVVDFIDLKYFAIFNFADIVISLGAMLILFSIWRARGSSKKS